MTWQQVHAFSQGLELIVPPDDPAPSWNVAPTQSPWVLVADPAGAIAEQMRWGLMPGWAKDPKIGASMINARLETAATKPSFRASWKARRCLVPASGYYEWRLEDGIKQPYFIHAAADPVLLFAGLWEHWKTPAGEWLHSFAIITRAADEAMLPMHERTPLMLAPPLLNDWLHGNADDAMAIAHAAATPTLAWHPVSRVVGNPRSNGPRLVEPIEATYAMLPSPA